MSNQTDANYWVSKARDHLLQGMTGASLPLAGVAITDKVFEGMLGSVPFSHFHSTGGHPVCCAVAIKVLDIIKEEKIVDILEATLADLKLNEI